MSFGKMDVEAVSGAVLVFVSAVAKRWA